MLEGLTLNSYDLPAAQNQDTVAAPKAELFAERGETIPGQNVFQNPGKPWWIKTGW